ncbi:MAG: ABC transporter permease [Bacilli bacterium]|nr:ABC transporter permease [Bacilli bacterium]
MLIKNIYHNLIKYKFLLIELIKRDFKIKYKRSVLGILWSVLYPLLMMSVMALIFSQMFKFNMEGVNFLVYLMTGLVMFGYFSEATNSSLISIVSNFSLINKVYIPKYIFPLAKCLFAGINFLLTLIPLVLIMLISGSPEAGTKCYLNIYYLIIPYIFLCIFMFTLGMSYLLSALTVFLRDIIYIWGIILTILNYVTPIFYPLAMLPTYLQTIFKLNPLYMYIGSLREVLLFSRMPSTYLLVGMFVTGFVMMIFGMYFFRKKQDKFVYYM